MPSFFFDIQDGDGFHPDAFGDEFNSLKDACDQAQVLLPDIARGELPGGERHEIMCEVRNEANRIVYRVRLTFRGEWVDEAG